MIIYILITKTRHLIGTMQEQLEQQPSVALENDYINNRLIAHVVAKHNEMMNDLENDIKGLEIEIANNNLKYAYKNADLKRAEQNITHEHEKNLADQEYNRCIGALEPPVNTAALESPVNTVVKYTDDQWKEWFKFIVDEYNKEMTELKRIRHLREREYSDRNCELKNNKDELERTMYRLKQEHNKFMFQLKYAMSDLKRAEQKGP